MFIKFVGPRCMPQLQLTFIVTCTGHPIAYPHPSGQTKQFGYFINYSLEYYQ